MAGFLKEYPSYSEFDYKWKLAVIKVALMISDAPRLKFKAKKKKDGKKKIEKIKVDEGTFKDLINKRNA